VSERAWYVYVLECGDGSLYTGVSNDVPRRLSAHRSGRGARYTRGRGPLILRGTSLPLDRSAALRLERVIKRRPRPEKLNLLHAASPDA
jgi:putative endonuclease